MQRWLGLEEVVAEAAVGTAVAAAVVDEVEVEVEVGLAATTLLLVETAGERCSVLLTLLLHTYLILQAFRLRLESILQSGEVV